MSNIITRIREKFNINQSEIALETGLSREYINKVEKGKLEISEKNISLLRQFYGDFEVVSNESQLKSENTITKKETKKEVKNESNVGLNETSVHSIIETNRNISRALEKMVETQGMFAHLLQSIMPSKKDTHQGLSQDILTKMAQILEYVVEVGAGKRWESKEDGYGELNRRFYGNSNVSQEADTLIGKDK